jgi:type II secretory pathway pseudopilin PulG
MPFHGRIARRFAEHDWFSVLVEFVIVLAGILAALAFDDWRQDRDDARRIHEQLAQTANEIRSNVWSIDRVQNHALLRKRQALETVIRYLDDPSRVSATPEQLLADFAESTTRVTPWLSDNQLQALQNSGDLRLLNNPALARDLAGTYSAERTLFSQIDALRGAYPDRVQELLPASLQATTNPLRSYASGKTSPAIADPLDATAALAQIRQHRTELLPLARGETAVCTATWYALERMESDFNEILKRLAPWDTSPVYLSDPPPQTQQPASNHATP